MVEMKKKGLVAALLSLLITGLGQMYLRRIRRGVLLFTLNFITAMLSLKWYMPGLLLNIYVSVVSVIDAYRIAPQEQPEKHLSPPEIREDLNRLGLSENNGSKSTIS
mgnify:CR=1 FL=1